MGAYVRMAGICAANLMEKVERYKIQFEGTDVKVFG